MAYTLRVPQFEKDHVYLFMLPASKIAGKSKLSCSSFSSKLEAYLMLTGISYTAKHSMAMGPYGKAPWIELNDEIHSDSSSIVDVLNAHFNKDLDSGLSTEQKAISHAFQRMIEESTYFHLVHGVWCDGDQWQKTLQLYFENPGWMMRTVMGYTVIPNVRKASHAQGTGRLPNSVILERFGKDIHAVSDYLGDKQYLHGTDKPTYVDVCIYGVLNTMLNVGASSFLDSKLAEFTKVVAYWKRINDLLFPTTPATAQH